VAYWTGGDLFIIYFLHNALPANCVQKDGHQRNSRNKHASLIQRFERTENAIEMLDCIKIEHAFVWKKNT
jgi:hypothetical protein